MGPIEPAAGPGDGAIPLQPLPAQSPSLTVDAIERAAAAIPVQVSFPIDVTFPGESEPDLIDDWVARNTQPFYTRE